MNKRKWMMFLLPCVLAIAAIPVLAQDGSQAIQAEPSDGARPEFDIVYARVERFGSTLLFHQVVVGEAGKIIPQAKGEFAGAEVYSYVWPTSLDSSVVGFDVKQGILALVVTSHPDFDDTPLVDEDGDGDNNDDGELWHSHWVVLVADEACGENGLKVKDIPEGATPTVPDTWPGVPLLIDSPSYDLELIGDEVVVEVPHGAVGLADSFNFDGVTAGLQINEDLHDPLLCVTTVEDIASGDLSLPGIAN